MNKKIIIIPSIIIGTILVLIMAALLLLSVFFPNEIVRKQIEKQGTELLGVNVKLDKLKFSVFRGFVLNGLSIGQKGNNWQYPEILTIDSIVLEYRLFPLLTGQISVKGFVVEKGELHFERKKGIGNYEYFIGKLSSMNSKSKKEITEKKVEKKASKRSDFPIDVNVKKAGLDGLTVTYNDDSFFDIPIFADLTDIKFLGRNISLKNNKLFDLETKINVKLNAGKYLEFNAKSTANGKLKIFAGDSFNVKPTGPVLIKVQEAGFKSNNINDLMIFFVKDYINSVFGGGIKSFLNNKNNVSVTAGEYFKNAMDDSGEKIKAAVKNAENLMQQKQEVINYNAKLLNEYDKQLDSSISDVEKKIDSIDEKTGPVLKAASRLNLITNIVDVDKYKKRISRLKNDVKSKRESLVNKYKSSLNESLKNKVNSQFPASIPTFGSIKKQYTDQIGKYKAEINKQLGKLSLESFIDSVLGDFKFFDKEWKITQISTIYNLGESQSEAKDIVFASNLFDLDGNMTVKDKYIDYTGEISVNVKDLGLDVLPMEKITANVEVNGVMPSLKIKLKDKPKLDMDKAKIQEAVKGIFNSFLKNNYGEDKILSGIIGADTNVNIDKIKKQMDAIKDGKTSAFGEEKTMLNDYIDKELNKIINELKQTPGL